ncbi:MAG: DNA repair exonuclease [Chlorobiaceae bacterium]|nr:DNA repair exonuclease [Chlorobiaceae bacterium]NTV15818.1 DNA repair exonuclease [Chlorobiaceae bacterium]
MFTFLHAADIHLDSPLKGLEDYPDAPLDQIRLAARRAFDNLVQLAIDEKVAFVLLAGDLYDGDWKDYNTGIYFVHRMGRLREAGIPVIMVSGNHDAASQITRSLKLPDNVTLLPHRSVGTLHLDQLGVAIHGQSFSSRSVMDDLVRNYPQGDLLLFNIGLLHTSLNGRPGHEPYAPCTLDALRSKGYQYWALGHIHQREEICRDPWVVFSGNIQGRHIRETGPKGCTLVSVDEGRVVSLEERELDVLRWEVCHVNPAPCDSVDSLCDLVREAFENKRSKSDGRPLAVRLIIEGITPLHGQLHEHQLQWSEEFRAVAANLGDVWIEKVEIKTRKSAPQQDNGSDDSPVQTLLKSVEAIQFEQSTLVGIVPEFEKLHSKLPPELLGDGGPFRPGKEELSALREEIREILVARIGQGGRHEN